MTDALQHSLFSDKPAQARARRGDPETSHEAARAASRRLSDCKAAILRIFDMKGELTDVELVQAYCTLARRNPALYPQQSPSGIRSRRAWLTEPEISKLYFTGRYRTIDGRRHRIWARGHA